MPYNDYDNEYDENGRRTIPVEYYCTACGGTGIIMDATCHWDTTKQEFVDLCVSDQDIQWCYTCEAETTVDERQITDVKTLAKIAIHKGVT